MKFLFVASMMLTGVILTLVADIFLKKGGLSDWRYFAIGFVLYGCVAVPVAFAFKHSEFGSLVLAWETLLVILSMGVAHWYFHEPFTIYRFIAVVLGIGAMFFAYK